MSWFKFKLPSMWSDYVSFGDYSWVMEILMVLTQYLCVTLNKLFSL